MRGRIRVKEAAKALNVSEQFIRIGLRLEKLPIGAAVKMSGEYTYYISPEKLRAYIGDARYNECFGEEEL